MRSYHFSICFFLVTFLGLGECLTAADWDPVQLTLAEISTHLSSQRCQESDANWVACLETLSFALSTVEKTLDWNPNQARFEIRAKVTVWENDWTKRYFEERNAEATREKNWLSLRTQNVEINFESLTQKVLATLTTLPASVSESALTAKLFNRFYSVALDPNARIEVSDDFNRTLGTSSLSTAGIGVIPRFVYGMSLVQMAVIGGPGYLAGLRPHDWVTSVNGEDIRGKEFERMLALVPGSEGTEVQLKVLRDGQPFSFAITRARVSLPHVESQLLTYEKSLWGYLQVHDLKSDYVCDQVQSALNDLLAQGAKGWILDLRDDAGGQLKQGGVCVASLFLKAGQTVLVEKNIHSGKETKFTTTEDGITDLPLVVLVNGYSASASEIVAGSLQGLERAVVVGERTYGKGTVQEGVPWNEGSRKHSGQVLFFQTTDCFYLPPDLHSNQAVSVLPNVVVYPKNQLPNQLVLREESLHLHPLNCNTKPYFQNLKRVEAMAKLNFCVSNLEKTKVGAPSPSLFERDQQLQISAYTLDCLALP